MFKYSFSIILLFSFHYTFTIPPGVYEIKGESLFGGYTGTVQVLPSTDKVQKIIRQVQYKEFSYHDYFVDQVMVGSLNSKKTLHFDVATSNFYFPPKLIQKNWKTPFDKIETKIEISGSLQQSEKMFELILYKSNQQVSISSEKWYKVSESLTPIWQNLRQQREVVSENKVRIAGFIDIADALSFLTKDYNKLNFIQPYQSNKEFIKEKPITIEDKTDFHFLRSNKKRIRVIQSEINNLTLHEALKRNQAYSFSFQEKEAYFYNQMLETFINNEGFVSYRIKKDSNQFIPDGDSATWTGIWLYILSLKYILDPSDQIKTQIETTLTAMLKALNLIKFDNSFARYVGNNYHNSKNKNEWIERKEKAKSVWYLRGGNNDMLKGYLFGIYWATRALNTTNSLQKFIEPILSTLNLVVEKSDRLGVGLNKFLAFSIQYSINPNKNHYHKIIRQYFKKTAFIDLIKSGGFPLNYKGISDWSGNNLNIMTYIMLYDFFANEIAKRNHSFCIFFCKSEKDFFVTNFDTIKMGIKVIAKSLKGHRLGLVDVVAGLWNDNDFQMISDGAWRLAEIPIMRGEKVTAHFFTKNFIFSPYPSLPWKQDWKISDDNRRQSLKNYPLFELGWSTYYWKSNPYSMAAKPGSTSSFQTIGIDFLVVYWFAKFHSINLEDYLN